MSLPTLSPELRSGGLKPRLSCAPPFAMTYAEEAIDFCLIAGLKLDLWQQDALRLMLAVRADEKWACFEYGEIVSRQNGKGAILEARVLAGLFLFNERLLMWSAHEYKTAMEAFLRVQQHLRVLEDIGVIAEGSLKTVSAHGEQGFEILNKDGTVGRRLKFIARSKSSGRGFSGDVNIVDEAFAFTSSQQAALMPTMSARPNPQIIYTSTPPLDGESGEPMYALRKRAEAGGDDSLGWRDWGLAGDLSELSKIDLDERESWAATNPALNIRITEETITRERRSMKAEDFARERLGVWPKQISAGGGAIDFDQWMRLEDLASRRKGSVTIAVDVAPGRDYAAIGLFGNREDGFGHIQLLDYRAGTEWIISRILELKSVLDPASIAMGRGTFASLEADLERAELKQSDDPEKPRRGDLVVLNATEMGAACAQIIDACRQEIVRHKGQIPLNAAVAGAHTRESNDAIVWVRKDSDTDICPIVVATEARWAHLDRAHRVLAQDYDIAESLW